MANIRSQIKRNRQNERRRLSNKSVRSEIRTRTKTALTAVDAGAEEAYRRGLERVPDSLPLAYRLAQLESRTKRPTAEAQWQRALRLGAHSAVVHADHARWLMGEGRSDEARLFAALAYRSREESGGGWSFQEPGVSAIFATRTLALPC